VRIRNKDDYQKYCELYYDEIINWDVDVFDFLYAESAIQEMEQRLKFVKEFWAETTAWESREKIHLAHFNETVKRHARRGFCSPIKTDEISSFERKAREVFGSVDGDATTSWNAGDPGNWDE
jgi:hypothetical protein